MQKGELSRVNYSVQGNSIRGAAFQNGNPVSNNHLPYWWFPNKSIKLRHACAWGNCPPKRVRCRKHANYEQVIKTVIISFFVANTDLLPRNRHSMIPFKRVSLPINRTLHKRWIKDIHERMGNTVREGVDTRVANWINLAMIRVLLMLQWSFKGRTFIIFRKEGFKFLYEPMIRSEKHSGI